MFQEAYCADVLVAVEGAGQMWSMFQKPNATKIEISWPKYGWPFYYSSSAAKPLVCAFLHLYSLYQR